jgi:hypothetical protein
MDGQDAAGRLTDVGFSGGASVSPRGDGASVETRTVRL